MSRVLRPKSEHSVKINKEQNFRSSKSVIRLANTLRDDLQQVPAGPNSEIEGDVSLYLVEAEIPDAPRKRYTDEQLDRALKRFDKVLEKIDWQDHNGSRRLYLTHQMIARRLGFLELHQLFNGEYASQRAKDEFQEGSHFLVKPIVETLYPIVRAVENGDEIGVLKLLRKNSPAFLIDGENAEQPLKFMLTKAKTKSNELHKRWQKDTIRDVLKYASQEELCKIGQRLEQHLYRKQRIEEYDENIHQAERSDWLSDIFFQNQTKALPSYCNFVTNNSWFSTKHGVKGEEYDDVLVFFDDVEASWSKYSFCKLFIPDIAGKGTSGQIERSSKLAYVCFTRAQKNLSVVLFCPSPTKAKNELVSNGIFSECQIQVLP